MVISRVLQRMPSRSALTPCSAQSPELMEPVLGALPLQLPTTGSCRTTRKFFSKHLYLLCFSRCLLPEPAALSEGLTCWTMKPPEELLTVELTKAGRQHFMHNPYAAHLKLIQQQKVQMERAQLLLFWCWQLSEEYQQFLKIILALLIGKHFQVQSEPAAMWLRWTSHRFLVQNTFVASTWRRCTTKTASMQHSTALV